MRCADPRHVIGNFGALAATPTQRSTLASPTFASTNRTDSKRRAHIRAATLDLLLSRALFFAILIFFSSDQTNALSLLPLSGCLATPLRVSRYVPHTRDSRHSQADYAPIAMDLARYSYLTRPSGLLDMLTAPAQSSLTQEEIPIKLRCAICNKLVINAFGLPCCDQSICENCTCRPHLRTGYCADFVRPIVAA